MLSQELTLNHPQLPEEDIALTSNKLNAVKTELSKVIVGQEHLVERLLIGLFTNGHILLEGLPGLAKTLTVSSLAQALSLKFKRIQFTPDLLPADLIGTQIYNQRDFTFEVRKGPLFANLVLADEINRAPAKVQSALLEAMQEKQVTIGDQTFKLELPFLVMATQNPIEQEGTYPLPEAQVDRFMMKVYVGYPSKSEEKSIMQRMASASGKKDIQPVLTTSDIFSIRGMIDKVYMDERLEDYIIDLIMATRNPASYKINEIQNYLAYGASPRASIALNMASRAHALFNNRGFVLPEDVKAVAPDVLNHRILLNYEAEADGFTSLEFVQRLLKNIPI